MANAHSAIDRLIALTTLKRYQGGGEVQPTMGQRFIQRFPSQHEDAMRAAEQERALAGLIDFIAPQSLGELGVTMATGPLLSKAGKVKQLVRQAYKNIKSTKTPALLKKFDIKVDNPLYHNTDIESANLILKKNLIGPSNRPEFIKGGGGSRRSSVSTTRDSDYSFVPGDKVSNELDIQIVLDKRELSKGRGTKISPYVYSAARDKERNPFTKGGRFYEAEERVYSTSGIPAKNIKAIKLRSPVYSTATLKTFIEESTKKNIPIIVEPEGENYVSRVLNYLNPSQKEKALKNIKFTN